MCGSGRWSCWQDLSSHLLHQQHFSNGMFMPLFRLWSRLCDCTQTVCEIACVLLNCLVSRIMFPRFLTISVSMSWLMGSVWIWLCGILLVCALASCFMVWNLKVHKFCLFNLNQCFGSNMRIKIGMEIKWLKVYLFNLKQCIMFLVMAN